MEKIKVAVIGCGNIANSAHIPAYMKNPKVEIKYFCDILGERAEVAVEKYGVGKAITDYHEALSDSEIGAVSVCTPNNMHSVIACDFLRAGKDVLCEKPAARVLDEALLMQKTQKETGRLLNIGVVNRYNDAVNKIRDYIKEGKLGEVFHVYISFRSNRSIPGLGGDFTTKAVSGGGALIDWGVHFIDLVMYCTGDPTPLTVTGEAFSKLGKDIAGYTYKDMWAGPPKADGIYDVEDSVTGMIRTTGPVVTFNGAWAQNIGENEMFIDFCGDKAGIRLRYLGSFDVFTAEHGALVKYTPDFKMRNAYENEINAFVDSLFTREHLPSNIDNAVITSRIMQAIYDSSDAHREIVL